MADLSHRSVIARDVGVVLVAVVLGAVLVVGGVQGSDDVTRDEQVGFVLAGVGALALGLNYVVVRLWRPRPPVTYGVEDGVPALVVGVSRAVPLGAAITSVAWAVFAGWLAAVLDSLAGAVVAGTAAALLVLAAVNAGRALLRRPRLVLTRERVSLTGWYADAGVDWADVASVAIVPSGTYVTAVRVSTVVKAASFTWAWRRLGLRRRPPRDRVLEVSVQAVAEPAALVVLLQQLHARDDGGRAALLGPEAAAFLDGSSARPDEVPGIVEL